MQHLIIAANDRIDRSGLRQQYKYIFYESQSKQSERSHMTQRLSLQYRNKYKRAKTLFISELFLKLIFQI